MEQQKTPTFEELQDKYREEHAMLLEMKRQLADHVVYTESPYSFNVRLKHPVWGVGQVTIRTRAPEEGKDFIWRVMGALENFKAKGWQSEHGEVAPLPTLTPTTVPAPTAPTPPPDNGTAQKFDAHLLVATMDSGKTYWKVKGGHFEKFGVTVYPEVLEAAGLTNCDPMKATDLTGWTAYYALKDDGKPSKVTRLARN